MMTERYQSAQKLLTPHTRFAVKNGKPNFCWQDDTLHYIRETAEGYEAVTVDALSGRKTIVKTDPQDAPSAVPSAETVSPDGSCALFYKKHDLYLRRNGEEIRLTTDGESGCEYGIYLDIYSQITQKVSGYIDHPLVLFSPDCQYFVTYRADMRRVKTLAVIESCGGNAEHLRPVVHEYACPFAVDSDDEMRSIELFLGNVEQGTLTRVDAPAYVHPVFTQPEKSFVKWLDDSSGFYFTWFDRAYHIGRLYFTDAASGETVLRVEDINDTFHNLGAFNLLDGFGAYQFSNFVTSDRRYAFWQSERSGYAHLYRYNENGECEGDLFGTERSSLIVQKLIRVDESAEKIYFMANNIPDCSDPLFYSLYVIGYDGSGLSRLTPEDANHAVSMGQNAFADTYSRVDLPPISVLRNLDGSLITELEQADTAELMASGYIIPERFTVKADDGITDLYGILIRPADFDPQKQYPLIDYVYGGAQLYNVPRDFTWDNVQNREIFGGLEEYAQLGFVGVIIDGRGTPGRGKAFHDFSYKRIHGCAGLDDHPGAIRRLKEQYPFIDLDRVGIWGNSGGGYATVSALLKYSDLYRVGVASSGNFDQRVYENSWTERYYGQYDPEVYQHGDITALAEKLTGKLLLACGCMDDNVTIWQTMRLCDELTRHNKDYDLMVLPRVNHNVPSDLYFMRRKMDYFVRHLLNEEPPREFTFDCM